MVFQLSIYFDPFSVIELHINCLDYSLPVPLDIMVTITLSREFFKTHFTPDLTVFLLQFRLKQTKKRGCSYMIFFYFYLFFFFFNLIQVINSPFSIRF